MYLLVDQESGYYVFTEEDPRTAATDSAIVESDVELQHPVRAAAWTPGRSEAAECLGRSPHDDRQYRVFNSAGDCRAAKYEPLGTNFEVVRTWEQFQAQPRRPRTERRA